jgi:WD40 repeat protein
MTKRQWLGACLAVGTLIVVAAVIANGLPATLPSQPGTAPGVVAGKALYLSPSFNGSGWIQIDPENLKDLSAKPLLAIAPTTANSSDTQVSADGSTIIVSDFSPSAVTRRVYDGRTGQLRNFLVPQVTMVIDHLSADGTLGLGRIGDNRNPLTGESAIITIADGHVVRRLFSIDIPGEIQATLVSPDLSTRYYVTTPTALSLTSTAAQSLPYSLLVRSWTDALTAPIPLPGMTAGTTLTGPAAGTPTTFRSAIAFSADGSRLAALSADGRVLDVVDTKPLTITTVGVHKQTSFLDLLRPLVAEAKTINDEERRSMVFTPDGTALISWMTDVRYGDVNGPSRTTRGFQRIDISTGLVTAENGTPDGIYGFVMSPDGRSLYVIARAKEPPAALYVLRRLDAQSLELKAERRLADYAELEVLAAPASSVNSLPPP